jgi:hypothetical protein
LKNNVIIAALFFLFACSASKNMRPDSLPHAVANDSLTGEAFFKKAVSYTWYERDSLALEYAAAGQVPDFYFHFVAVTTPFTLPNGKTVDATFFVAPDYFMVGTNSNWARVPITPMAAQKIADAYGCFLPTPSMVDAIYTASKVRLEPVPMYAFRDSTITMWQHHLIIEGQRKGKKGLISGIKKDVVLSNKVAENARPNRVAIYGWHKLDGKPIQPVYAGHVNWYVDYSHGIRLIAKKVRVKGAWLDYTTLLGPGGETSMLRY